MVYVVPTSEVSEDCYDRTIDGVVYDREENVTKKKNVIRLVTHDHQPQIVPVRAGVMSI